MKRGAGGTITCTYGHEHHDDPNAVNDIFGPPGAWAGIAGQEISYPWQTASTLGPENHVKHEGYKVYTARDHPCVPASTAIGTNGCFRAWRVQVHAMGHASDAITRFHSFSFEALVEHPDGTQGIIRHGGWIDGGYLALTVNTGTKFICPRIDSNPPGFNDFSDELLAQGCGRGTRRVHSSANVPAPYTAHNTYFANWYAAHQHTAVAPHLEEWGPIDYQNPSNQLFHDPARRANNSRGRPELMSVDIRQSVFHPYKDAQGRITFNGYSNRNGTPVSGCSAPSVDCVPLVIEGVKALGYQWSANNSRTGPLVDREHDIASPATGKSLIRFPN